MQAKIENLELYTSQTGGYQQFYGAGAVDQTFFCCSGNVHTHHDNLPRQQEYYINRGEWQNI